MDPDVNKRIHRELTQDETSVLLLANPAPGYKSAPKLLGRRSGKIMRRLAKKGMFRERYEKANGLWWFDMTPMGRAMRNEILVFTAAVTKLAVEKAAPAKPIPAFGDLAQVRFTNQAEA